MKKDGSWGTNIDCKCGGKIQAYVAALGAKYIKHGFFCSNCTAEGDWENLVRGYYEARRRSQNKASKTPMAPREF